MGQKKFPKISSRSGCCCGCRGAKGRTKTGKKRGAFAHGGRGIRQPAHKYRRIFYESDSIIGAGERGGAKNVIFMVNTRNWKFSHAQLTNARQNGIFLMSKMMDTYGFPAPKCRFFQFFQGDFAGIPLKRRGILAECKLIFVGTFQSGTSHPGLKVKTWPGKGPPAPGINKGGKS